MLLLDTDVISELRKAQRMNAGVRRFFAELRERNTACYISAITVGELRRGVELVRRRGDHERATLLETWLNRVLENFADSVLDFDADAAQVWGKMRVPHPENALDKQIAAIAWLNDLTLVTRNVAHFASTGVRIENPFTPPSSQSPA